MITLYQSPEVNSAKNVLAHTKTWKDENEHRKQAGESQHWLLHRFSGYEGQMPLPLGVTIQWYHTTDVHFRKMHADVSDARLWSSGIFLASVQGKKTV